MRRSFLASALSTGAALILNQAQAQVPASTCIGRHTIRGMTFRGLGSVVTDPFTIREGAIFARSRMSDAGAIYLMNAAGSMVLLRNESEPGPITEANSVFEGGQYYLVVDFYGDEGPWSLVIEQPSTAAAGG